MAAARSAIIADVARFLQPGPQQFSNVIDKNVALRFHEASSQISFFSSKMNAHLLARHDAGGGSGFVLRAFEGHVSLANMRPKCFLSAELADAQAGSVLVV